MFLNSEIIYEKKAIIHSFTLLNYLNDKIYIFVKRNWLGISAQKSKRTENGHPLKSLQVGIHGNTMKHTFIGPTLNFPPPRPGYI